ncbi:MAG: N-methylhydantoinase [Thermoleophilaceae bacterium]|nr:N-methylhydantoinase [Thermoleophilaceae bacterium]
MSGIRVGVDVGGTFTKAVAVASPPVALLGHVVVSTSHRASGGVTEGLTEALRRLFADLGERRGSVELVAFSTTQAMNALLEGDVARVGVIGIGAAPDLRLARKRTRVGDVKLAPKRALYTEHAFLDATHGLDAVAIEAALDRLEAAGCAAVAVSGAFAVDAPEHERLVSERASARGLPVCAGHELTGTYGLETRTVSAAINASILPVVERTATAVEEVLAEAGIDVPLLVLRGDGGAMSIDSFRRGPSLTVGSGPAAGAAAALHALALDDAIVLECGGTSSNVSVVKGGRTALRTLRVMGRPTAIRSVDSWVVGAAGGSMPRLGRRRIEEVGPRSAHIAGLPYACYADPDALSGAQVELTAPRPGDPPRYGVLVAGDGSRYALTATCAAHALDLVDAGGASRDAALAGFAALGRRTGRTPERAARELLDGAVAKIADAVIEAARAHGLAADVPVVALGGAGGALAPEVARRLGRPCLRPDHPEVLSSIGAALSLVRAEVVRHGIGPTAGAALAREAERACVEAGAAPQTVQVETSFDARETLLRATATGAVALESGAAHRDAVDEPAQRRAASSALGLEAERLGTVAETDFYRVFCENGSGAVAVVDRRGSVAFAERATCVVTDHASRVLEPLSEALDAATLNLGVATLLPRVAVVCGSRIVDLSDARRSEDMLRAAAAVLDGHDGSAVAVIWQ